jgi:hypothetical protein
MNQLEIKFFWSLTEQIPLELDYTGCEAPKLSVPSGTYQSIGIGSFDNITTGVTSISPFLRIENENLTVAFSKKQPWYRKWIYKLLGIKMEMR